MNNTVSAKKSLFLIACLILAFAMACGGGTVTTWQAQTSYSPYSLSAPYKAADPLEIVLGAPVHLRALWDDCTEIGCTADNRWAIVSPSGDVFVQDLQPPETPCALQYDGKIMIAECASGRYEVVRLSNTNITPQLSASYSIIFARRSSR